jgi:hypothetical protein
MVPYNILGYCVLGFYPSFYILKNIAFRNPDLFLSSGEKMDISTLSGPLQTAKVNHWIDLVSETLCSLGYWKMGKAQKPSNIEGWELRINCLI